MGLKRGEAQETSCQTLALVQILDLPFLGVPGGFGGCRVGARPGGSPLGLRGQACLAASCSASGKDGPAGGMWLSDCLVYDYKGLGKFDLSLLAALLPELPGMTENSQVMTAFHLTPPYQSHHRITALDDHHFAFSDLP